MQRVEWVVPDEVYWFNLSLDAVYPSTLKRISSDNSFNQRLAYVEQLKPGEFEAVLLRNRFGKWSLGRFDNIKEAKDAVLLALTLERMGQL